MESVTELLTSGRSKALPSWGNQARLGQTASIHRRLLNGRSPWTHFCQLSVCPEPFNLPWISLPSKCKCFLKFCCLSTVMLDCNEIEDTEERTPCLLNGTSFSPLPSASDKSPEVSSPYMGLKLSTPQKTQMLCYPALFPTSL